MRSLVDRLLAIQTRYRLLRGNASAAAITLYGFLSLFPLAFLAIATVGFISQGSSDITKDIVDWLGVEGAAARTVTKAVATARHSRRAATIVGLLGLLWTALGLTTAIGNAYNTAWQVPNRGLKERVYGLAWAGGALVLIAATFAAVALLDALPSWFLPVGILLGLGFNTALWLWTSIILANRRVPWRALLPAALVGALGFEILKVAGTLWLPRFVARSSALFGSIGVVFSLLLWLFILGRLVVYVTAIEVTSWEREHGTVQATVERPALPGD